uniref:Uncharacterized protein n=1 Tax=Arundo donax TaxID=35708 RepID=A0A0A8XXC5_ARUDO
MTNQLEDFCCFFPQYDCQTIHKSMVTYYRI